MQSKDTANIDELDSLINNLNSEPQPQVKASASVSASGAPGDDLDSLMNSLSLDSSTKSSKPAAAPAVSASASASMSAPKVSANTDDLDDLLGELSASTSTPAASSRPAAPKTTPPNVRSAQPTAAADSLDDLLNDLSGPSGNPAPTAKPAASGGDSLDDLLGQLSNSSAPSASGSAAAAGAPADNKGNDLDSLLNNLSSGSDGMGTMSGSSTQGVCAKCGKPITGQITTALGKSFHPEHFTCNTCQKVLGTSTFYDVGGMPQCEQCFKNLSCPRCGYCDQPIVDRYVTALGKKWHPEHFVCAQCLQPFPNGAFFERDSKPYCESCFYSMYAYRCAGCNEVIKGECITAFGQRWHPEHFNCQYCHEPFKDGAFFEYQGKPYCELHYHQMNGSLCSGCGKAVGSRSLTALGRKWHPEHFVCAFCMNPLAGTSFKEGKGKPYCTTCYNKLFGQ